MPYVAFLYTLKCVTITWVLILFSKNVLNFILTHNLACVDLLIVFINVRHTGENNSHLSTSLNPKNGFSFQKDLN